MTTVSNLERNRAHQEVQKKRALLEAQYDAEASAEGHAICRGRAMGSGALNKGKRLMGGLIPAKFQR